MSSVDEADLLEAAFQTFVTQSHAVLAADGTKAESSLYSQFETLLADAFAACGGHELLILQQVNAEAVGIPDYKLQQSGDLLGWVELKAVVGKPLDDLKGHDAEQRDRFVNGLHNLLLTNGYEWQLYQDGRPVGLKVVLGDNHLFTPNSLSTPLTNEQRNAFLSMLKSFLGAQLAPYTSAAAAVTALASRAKALKSGLIELGESDAGTSLQSLKNDFRDLLFRHGQRFTWENFVDSYVQIAAFGALLWRLETKAEISLQSQVGLKHTIHPLLAQCLTILWSPPSQQPVLKPLLEELCRTVNLVEPHLFEQTADDSSSRRYIPDPIVHAYEPFFSVYDRASRDAKGVFYTPVQIVEHIVTGVERMLTNTLQRTSGLLDEDARFLDPATGTGTFLLGLAQAVLRAAEDTGAPTDLVVKEVITQHLAAFELFPGPYTIAHQRLEAYLQSLGAEPTERLPIYLADTLAAPASGQLGGSGFGVAGSEIIKEREMADRVKTEEKILVILGNPPYERVRKKDGALEAFAQGLLGQVVQATPVHMRADLKSTNDLYVAFWAWALWALQLPEKRLASGDTPTLEPKDAHGIIAFITNRTWIGGRSLYGLRHLVRQGAKEVWVHDLGGDARGNSGARSFAGGDANVFNIRTGVAIVWVVFDRTWDGPCTVRYRRSYGSRKAKLAQMLEPFDDADYEIVGGEGGAPFVPVAWPSALEGAPRLVQLFSIPPDTGFQTARDTKAVRPIGLEKSDVFSATILRSKGVMKPVLGGSLGVWAGQAPGTRSEHWRTAQAERTGKQPPNPTSLSESKLRRVLYRPLDYRWLYDDPDWVDWYRESLHAVYEGVKVPTIITNPTGQGRGPAIIMTNVLPDQHAFNNRGGKGVYPLTRPDDDLADVDPRARQHGRISNLSPFVFDWLESLEASDAAIDAFNYISALLTAPSYTSSYWRALEVDSPRVPLTAHSHLFKQVSALGAQIAAAWQLDAPKPDNLKWSGNSTASSFGTVKYSSGTLQFSNGRVLEGVPESAWKFEVSGYLVLRRWFKARAHWNFTLAHAEEGTRVTSAVIELVAAGLKADDLLHQVLNAPTWSHTPEDDTSEEGYALLDDDDAEQDEQDEGKEPEFDLPN